MTSRTLATLGLGLALALGGVANAAQPAAPADAVQTAQPSGTDAAMPTATTGTAMSATGAKAAPAKKTVAKHALRRHVATKIGTPKMTGKHSSATTRKGMHAALTQHRLHASSTKITHRARLAHVRKAVRAHLALLVKKGGGKHA